MDAHALDTFFASVPKAEIHVHLIGAVPLPTLIALAKRHGVPLPYKDDPAELYERGENFDRVLKTLKLIATVMRDADDFRRVAYDVQADAARCGVVYREIFWNPTDHITAQNIPYEVAQDALIAGLRDAERDHGIIGRLIPSIDREGSPELGLQMVEATIAHPRDETIGIGMDYLEIDHPPEKFWRAYRRAGEAGLRRTAHAGEMLQPARNVATALDLLGCERIDHGYTIIDDPALLQRAKDAGIIFTVVPSNSTYSRVLKGQDFLTVHPLAEMVRQGLRLSPASDDPPLHHTDPAHCYTAMVTTFGATLDDCRAYWEATIDAAFVDDGTRRAWRAEWLSAFDAARAKLAAAA
ncbi:MAG: adenosine deaminase family protein [Pseudomonadota bacterium]